MDASSERTDAASQISTSLAKLTKTYTKNSDSLVTELNVLLASMSLPITLSTPYDLTPSLLLAILESILRMRLPISDSMRESRTRAAKVEAMKVLLGVLEDDVLRTDIGLSEIDPRRLAQGEWDEIVFVGETLCWLWRRQMREMEVQSVSEERPVESASSASNPNTSLYNGCSLYDTSETNVTTVPPFDSVLDLSEPHGTDTPGYTGPPRCIHEVDDSYFFFDDGFQSTDIKSMDEFCDCSLVHAPSDNAKTRSKELAASPIDTPSPSPSRPAIRYQGLIEPVEDDIEAFEAWRKHERSRLCSTPIIPRPDTRRRIGNPTRHTSPVEYKLSLLNERARLLSELAKMRIARTQHGLLL